MEKRALQQAWFLVFSLIFVLVVTQYEPKVYGNDKASIEKYIMQEVGLELQDHVELLAVEDRNADRIVIFQRETKRPDEVWFVRFRQNENGDYEGYAPKTPMRMYGAHPGNGIYSEPISGWGKDPTVYYTIWSENPKLDTVSFHLKGAEKKLAKVTENPSITIFEFYSAGGWSITTSYYDAAGEEIM